MSKEKKPRGDGASSGRRRSKRPAKETPGSKRPAKKESGAERPGKETRGGKSAASRGPEADEDPRGERIQKILARAGLGSRRKCEELITDGRVTVDGRRVTELGTRADPHASVIHVDGRRVRAEPSVYYVLHKPAGAISTTDESRHERVVDLVPPRPRVFPVGRLDVESEGLMVLTNDGNLANRMTHPRYGLERRYRATVKGDITERALQRLGKGVRLAEGKTLPPRVKVLNRSPGGGTLEVIVKEGLNREVRRILAAVGLKVKKLVRVALGPLMLKGIPKGDWREITRWELAALRKATAGPGEPPPKWLRRTKAQRRKSGRQRYSGRRGPRR